MATTISADSVDAPSESLRESIAKYSTGHYSKRDITRVLSQAVEAEPNCCEAIQEFLDDRLHSRQMTTVDHRELSSILDSLTTEGLPTESSSEKPAESGLYKIDGEGTMILASEADKKNKQKSESDKSEPDREKPHPSTRLGPGSVLRERYRLEQEVARGSMGLVYRATDLFRLDSGENSPTVAVKVINPEFSNNKAALKSFRNEVANTQHLSHPNIVNLFELDKCDDHYYITMEWLEGESLDALLDRSRGSALPPIQAYAIIEQLCDALIYAHQRRVVHADIKPGNVFLTKMGELKLIDFGIAHFEETLGSESGKNKKSIALTPAYASCECLEKQRPTAQDDLFSLACLIYRLLSGRRVFGSRTALQAEAEGVEPVPIGGISETRWQAIRKALAYRRADRYTDVKTFAEDFGRRETPRNLAEPPEAGAEVDDSRFTETSNLELSEADIQQAFMSSPDLSSIVIDDEGSDLLGTSQLLADDHADVFPLHDHDHGQQEERCESEPEQQQPDAILVPELESEDLDSLPEPINFFDDDSDDSVFVPLEAPVDAGPAADPVTESTIPIESATPTESTVPLEISVAADEVQSVPGEEASSADSAPAPAKFGSPSAGSNSQPESVRLERLDPADWGYTAVPASPPPESLSSEPTAEQDDSASAKNKKQPIAGAVKVERANAKPSGVTIERLMKPAIRSASLSVPERLLILFEERAARAGGLVGALLLAIAVVMFINDDPSSEGAAPSVSESVENTQRSAEQDEFIQAVVGRPVSDAEILASQGGDSDSPIAATTGQTELPVNRADTGIALEGTAVPVIFGPQAGGSSPGATSAATVSPELREFNDQARRALEEGRLVGADNGSAADWLEKMRANEPDIAFTQAIEAGLVAALIERAVTALDYRDLEDAIYWTGQAADYGASEARVAELRNAIDALRSEASAASGGTQGANIGNAGALAVEVPISELKFMHYEQPEYPQLLAERGLQGWVDVRFRIRPDGVPTDIRVTGTNLPPRFAAPSISAVESWRFVPYTVDGTAVPVISIARISYSD